MATPRTLTLLTMVPVLVAAVGCNYEYDFPNGPRYAQAPRDIGSWLSMDVAPDGVRPTVTFYDRFQGGISYAVGTPGADGTLTWTYEQVDGYPDENGLDLNDVGKFTSQATAPDGTVWVAYTDAVNRGLRVAHRIGGGVWDEPTIVDIGSGQWASLALDGAGNPVVAHTDPGAPSVKISRFAGGSWETEVAYTPAPFEGVDPDGLPVSRPAGASHTRLLIDGGTEYVAFHDSGAQALRLLEGGKGNWSQSVLDESGEVGQWPSLAKDGAKLYVAYHDVGNQDLMLATKEGASIAAEVVDQGAFKGADTEVFVRGGAVNIVYFDGENNDMLHAVRNAGSWKVEQLGGADAAVGFHNEVVEVADGWWVASYDFTNRVLFTSKLN